MTGDQRQTSTLPSGRGLLALVLLVLIGLVGMHGLPASALTFAAPTSPATPTEVLRTANHSAHSVGNTASHQPDSDPHAGNHQSDGGVFVVGQESVAAGSLCHHDSTGGHSAHSVSDCAAAGVVTAYLPPAPECCFGVFVVPVAAVLWRASAERAPPDLAQLQLLRI